MGLDQYLYRKNYVKRWEWEKDHQKGPFVTEETLQRNPQIDDDRICYIVEEIAVWRKFNALHGWMVEHCQDEGENDIQIYVDSDNLTELHADLVKVRDSLKDSEKETVQIKAGIRHTEDGTMEPIFHDVPVFTNTTVAEELFPVTSGFYFGSYQYDHRYYENVCATIETLEALFDEEGWNEHSYEYYASY